jgi:hypothetical protein
VNSMRFKRVLAILLSCVWLGLNSVAWGQRPDSDFGSLRVTVTDPHGAVIPGARVTVTRSGKGDDQTVLADERGEAVFQRLGTGQYAIHVEADGFKAVDVEKVSLKSGARHMEVQLDVAGANEKVEVKRNDRESLIDPRGDAFTTILTQAQIDQMPDDPDEFEQMLQEMAGPGGMIRVDGFMGGKLPPKSQIREIRIRQNPYAAENHFSGFVIIDVYTKPGIGLWHGTMGFGFRNEATMARPSSVNRLPRWQAAGLKPACGWASKGKSKDRPIQPPAPAASSHCCTRQSAVSFREGRRLRKSI